MKLFLIVTVAVTALALVYVNSSYERDMARCQATGLSYDTCFLQLK